MSRHNVHLSKSLSRILRHEAHQLGLPMKSDGYVNVSTILTSPKCWLSRHGYCEDDVMNVVEMNDKQRFSVRRDENGELEIRANQGHSVPVRDLELRRITDPDEFPNVIHGTYLKFWPQIRDQGLKTMSRTHVHFSPGVVGEEGVISGMRKNCNLMIYLNLKKAMEDGLEFYISSNKVILCSGNSDNVIHPKYFLKVVERSRGVELTF